MIPVRLELRDFLSYAGPEVIDFTRFDVACLSGPNGVGKSSLLDAMTWALFASARGCEGGRNQDRLIRDGADATSVDFTFELGGTTYRVRRARTRAGKPDVRFTALTPDGWTSMAGDTVQETDARIGDVLRMDYRTFVTSAFLLQGRADDFLARMKPEERKEVFATLLDLGSYERLESAAKERAREAERRRSDAAARREQILEVAEDAEALYRAHEAAEAEAADLEDRSKRAEAHTETLRSRVQELEKTEVEVGQLRTSLDELVDRVTSDESARAAKQAELDRLEELLARAEEVDDALAEIASLGDAVDSAERARAEAGELGQRVAVLEQRVADERARLEREEADRRAETERLETEARDLGARRARLVEVERTLTEVDDVPQASNALVAAREEHGREHARLEERLAGIGPRIAEIDERLELLGGPGGTCPVCGGALDDQHRERIAAELAETRTALGEQEGQESEALEASAKELRRLDEEIDRTQALLGEREALIVERESLRGGLLRSDEVARALEEARSRRSALATALEAPGAALMAEIDELRREIARVYDPEEHDRIRSRLRALKPYEELAGRLAEAGSRRESILEELEQLDHRIAKGTLDVDARRAQIAGLDDTLTGAEEARGALEEAQAELSKRRERVSAARADVARLQTRLESARRSAEEVERLEGEERDASLSAKRYARLAKAFGRSGIPHRIIENALPDLREEANAILSRLTDGEMYVQFVMAKDTKAGKVKETFDVLVHHEGGVRDFQMFSGGEAFRVAFAVRLALSKLLVSRAGARLETLVVDEGFGTQDPEGRERLIEAISLARAEFGKVLVITHLDELRDAFGTQLRVSRDASGASAVRVVGD